ncbi:MAG: hypothetical protein ACI3W8_06570 [Oscillospiraceae bacterium]
MCVNIYPDGKFNLNGKLAEKLRGKAMEIKFTPDGKHFMMEEAKDAQRQITFPKSGSRKLAEVADLLEKHKITLPARYEVWFTDDGFWQGDHMEDPTQPRSEKPRTSRKS